MNTKHTFMEEDASHRLPYAQSPYFKVGRATELSGADRRLYRFLEILPGLVTWMTLIGTVLLSVYAPVYAAYFIIAFSLYWLLKTLFLSVHLRHNWKRVRHHLELDWGDMLDALKYEHLYHVVLLPFYKESEDVVDASLKALTEAHYDTQKMIVVLAAEERAGEEARAIAERMKEKWGEEFAHFVVTIHPENILGEMAGKGSNTTWAIQKVQEDIIDREGIPYEDIIVSTFDIDTVVYPDYFNCLTWHFLTSENPYKTSFQPIPLFNNNMWEAGPLSRVVGMSSTFWEMVQQERPERMATFSSHSVSFKALHEIGYWQTNMVSEDSRIYWNLLIANDGNYTVTPISYPVSMDANTSTSFFGTVKNIYKQHRRWTYGVENLSYIIFNFIKNKKIPLGKRIKTVLVQAEGYWSLVTNPIMLFILGWFPIFLGGRAFQETVLSYNLPIVVRNLLIMAMLGLVVSAVISLTLLPPRPKHKRRFMYITLGVQWILVPLTMVVFSSLPGLDAQTRLMLGKYMGFWVTPKERKT